MCNHDLFAGSSSRSLDTPNPSPANECEEVIAVASQFLPEAVEYTLVNAEEYRFAERHRMYEMRNEGIVPARALCREVYVGHVSEYASHAGSPIPSILSSPDRPPFNEVLACVCYHAEGCFE